jgi:methyl-accepting chemotaxis protein
MSLALSIPAAAAPPGAASAGPRYDTNGLPAEPFHGDILPERARRVRRTPRQYKKYRGDLMKLRNKLTLTIAALMAVIIGLCLTFVFLRSSAIVENEARDKLLLIVRAIESQLYAGFQKEGHDGTNPVLQRSLDAMKKEMPEIIEISLYKLGDLNKAVASTKPEAIGKSVDPEDSAAAREDRTVILRSREEGLDVLDVTAPLHFESQVLYVAGVQTDIGKDRRVIGAMLWQTGLIGAIAIGIAAVVVLLSVGRITRPLARATDLFRAVSEGDLSRGLDIRSRDEIGDLARAINQLVETLRGTVTGLKAVIRKGGDIGARLTEKSGELSGDIDDINTTVAGLSRQVESLNEEIQKPNLSVGEINQYIQTIKDRSEEQSLSVRDSSVSIEEMVASITSIARLTEEKMSLSNDLSALAETGSAAMAQTMGSIKDIAGSAQEITEMIRLINGVAQETNLLAMNASIEAAHAGQYGRGFAVVAEEIRKLSEATRKNANGVSVTLKKIQEKIANTSSVTERTEKTIGQIIQGIKEVSAAMNETLMGLREISVGTGRVTEAIGTLKKTTGELASSSGVVTERVGFMETALARLIELALENNAGFERIREKISEISASIASLSTISGDNATNVQAIQTGISGFRTADIDLRGRRDGEPGRKDAPRPSLSPDAAVPVNPYPTPRA